MSERKVVVIGLDGATWNLIKPWADKGELPTFKKLMNKGVWGILESPFPVTVPSWACYSTGKNPGKFGVFDWIKVDIKNKKIEAVNYRDFKSKEIWDYLNEYGIKTGIINIPHTYPPKKVDGFMISGMLASEISNYTYPKSLKNELEDIGYRIHPRYLATEDKKACLNDVKKLIKLRFEVAKQKIEEVDFLHLTIFYIDHLQHFLWGEPELLDAWKTIDNALGDFLRELDTRKLKYTLILMSDHGFTKSKSNLEFYLSNFLIKKKIIHDRKTIFNYLNKIGITIDRLSILAKKVGVYEWGRQHLRKIVRKIPTTDGVFVFEGIESIFDWNRSKAFCSGGFIGLVYLKEKGSMNLHELIRDLLKLKDPKTNEKIISEVKFKREILSGEFLDDAPDIILYPHVGYTIRGYNIEGSIFRNGRWKATHTKNGIFLFYGDDIKPSATDTVNRASIYDLAPTILSLFGVPVPEDMDGRVLTEFLDVNIVKEAKETTSREKERIRKIIRKKFKKW